METKLRIQNLILPQVGVCMEYNMFYRTPTPEMTDHERDEHCIRFMERRIVCDFATYFNGLSIEKWKKYTNIGKVSLCLILKGKFDVVLENHVKVEGNISSTIVDTQRVEGDGKTAISFPYEVYAYRGMLSFSLISLEADAVFKGGWYEAEVEEKDLQDVNLAVNICTFKREHFIMRNIDLLNRNILKNPNSELYEHLQVFISDNGQTLPIDQLNTDKIHIVPNKNVGGAGGFSRGLIEIIKHQKEYPSTHAIMMDDDIIIQTESLVRTYMLLRCRKEQYKDMFVGGAMLRLDHQAIQVESGASWNAGRLISNKSGLDLNELDPCLYNEVEEYTEFNAWWYCCTPMSVVTTSNLPMPIFIRGDDLEYGLRNMKTLVLLNGICVWHEPFENKYSSFLQYYILRNMLYDNALHFRAFSKWKALMKLYRSAARDLLYYRYKNVELTARGVNDFLKGVDFLLKTDGEKLHKEIMADSYKAAPIEELPYQFRYPDYDASLRENESRIRRIFRMLTLNGYLLPVRKNSIKCVSMAACKPINFYRQKTVVNYDAGTNKAFITRKSYKDLIHCLSVLAGTTLKVIGGFDKAKRDFAENGYKVQNKEFWNEYLDN